MSQWINILDFKSGDIDSFSWLVMSILSSWRSLVDISFYYKLTVWQDIQHLFMCDLRLAQMRVKVMPLQLSKWKSWYSHSPHYAFLFQDSYLLFNISPSRAPTHSWQRQGNKEGSGSSTELSDGEVEPSKCSCRNPSSSARVVMQSIQVDLIEVFLAKEIPQWHTPHFSTGVSFWDLSAEVLQ